MKKIDISTPTYPNVFALVEDWVRVELKKTWSSSEWLDLEAHMLHSYCCGNGFGGIGSYSNSYPESITDVRFIFWFDC